MGVSEAVETALENINPLHQQVNIEQVLVVGMVKKVIGILSFCHSVLPSKCMNHKCCFHTGRGVRAGRTEC